MRDLLKEAGKYFLDLSKITFALAFITPLVKDGSFSLYAIIGSSAIFILGLYISYKGGTK